MEKPVQISRVPKSKFYETIFEINERQSRIPPQIQISRLSKLVAERVVADAERPIPECTTCGACCVHGLIIPIGRREPEPLSRFVEITLDDAAGVVVERAFERSEIDGRCVNLTGEIGVDIGCAIYSDRPQICRDFAAGSDRCFGYRRMSGIDPPLTEDEFAKAMRRLDSVDEPVRIRGIEIRVASKGMRFNRTAADPSIMMVEFLELKIAAHMSDGVVMDIHTFDPANESWYEHELEGMTLEAALECIEQRRAVGK